MYSLKCTGKSTSRVQSFPCALGPWGLAVEERIAGCEECLVGDSAASEGCKVKVEVSYWRERENTSEFHGSSLLWLRSGLEGFLDVEFTSSEVLVPFLITDSASTSHQLL